MNKLKEKFAKFMYGRYGGNDALNKALLWGYLIILLIGALCNLRIFWYVGLLLMVACLFRMFSRNIAKRQKENMAFLKFKSKVKVFWKRIFDFKHAYRTCPHCGATVRLPRKKGKHTVTCPKCRRDFDVKI